MGQGWSNTGTATVASAERGDVTRKEKMEFPAAAVPEGMAKCKKKRNRKTKQVVANAKENEPLEQEAASVAAAAEGEGVNKKVDVESPATAVPEDMAKCKKRKTKKRKPEVPFAKENGTAGQEAASFHRAAEIEEANGKMEVESPATAITEGMAKCTKRRKRKRGHEVVNAKENGMVQHEAASAASDVLALEGRPKSKKKAKAKERVMAGQEATATAVSILDKTAKCELEEEGKAMERGMVEEGTTTSSVSASEGTMKHKRKLKKKTQEQQEPTHALSGPAVVDKIAASKPVTGATNGEGTSVDAVSIDPRNAEDPNCSKAKDAYDYKKKKALEKEMVVEELTTTSTVSEGITRRKRKKLKKVQEQQEPAEALSDLVVVDNIASSKHVTGGTNGEGASGDAGHIMDLDPNCSMDANDNDKNANGRDLVEQGTTTSGVSGRVAKHNLDSPMKHDLSSTCASCLVEEHNEKVRNIFSPRGSLIRFQRKKLLILDLNGLLADINMDIQNAHMAHGKVRGKLVFKRPYYYDFLRFCFQNFELGIWSSRKKENVHSVVDILMRDLKQHLLFCWDMSKCTFTGQKVIGDRHKPLVLKELKHLWNKEDPNLPWKQGEFSPSNTLLVDDSPYKALCNPPHTAIFPQPYSYLNEKDDFSLGPGGDLRLYLERLAAADDVQVFVRDNPFGQPCITDRDPKWKFYSNIVNKVERGLSLKRKF